MIAAHVAEQLDDPRRLGGLGYFASSTGGAMAQPQAAVGGAAHGRGERIVEYVEGVFERASTSDPS